MVHSAGRYVIPTAIAKHDGIHIILAGNPLSYSKRACVRLLFFSSSENVRAIMLHKDRTCVDGLVSYVYSRFNTDDNAGRASHHQQQRGSKSVRP